MIKKLKFIKVKKTLFVLAMFPYLGVIALLIAYINYHDKIYPNILVSGINIGGLQKEEAYSTLYKKIKKAEKINLKLGSDTYTMNVADFDFSYDFKRTKE